MQGLMMNTQLTITTIMQHAKNHNPNVEIVSVTGDNPRHRTTYKQAFERAGQLANALAKLGVQSGDRVATLAWNDYRHFEAYYGVSCSGLVLHTINPRLFPEQIAYIVNHAEDQWLMIDAMFWPLAEKLAPELKGLKGFIVMTDKAHMPETSLDNVHCYEELIAGESSEFDWPELDEQAACALCYTSGTTGNPKGVLYSHRSTTLHAMAECLPDAMGLSASDAILPVVPMFHVNAWGIPYAAPMVGAKLVFPGPKMGDGEALQDLIESENVTLAAGVPTVWLGLLNYLRESGKRVDCLERTVVGGSACPIAIMKAFKEEYDVDTLHAWGMTEMSPIGTMNVPLPKHDELSGDDYWALKAKQGRAVYGVEMKIVDDENKELPHDGKAFGALKVRGPWVCSSYYKLPDADAHDADGWFGTGDVSTIDPDGYMQITDRTKDVIKSGGEWISSIELENIAMGHPDVAEAAVIAVAHPKWDERPLLVVVKKEGAEPSKQDLLDYFDGKVATWWKPNDVAFVDEIPHTATGKIQKLALRQQFEGYQLPE
ncbi:MAG: 3-(methylthio)propionyl-CoA ligase [Salinisphaeraceae bacterium]|nr:3-(methylthio)propionyl-CoA ligase [Salinisphaeraceae bacterium]